MITRRNSEGKPKISTRPDPKRLIFVLAVLLGLSSARAQQEIDLTGYTLGFEDELRHAFVAEPPRKGNAKLGRLDCLTGRPVPFSSAIGWAAFRGQSPKSATRNGVLSHWTKWIQIASVIQAGETGSSGCFLASMDKRRNGFAPAVRLLDREDEDADAGQGAWSAFWLACVPAGFQARDQGLRSRHRRSLRRAVQGRPQEATNTLGSFIPGMLTEAKRHNPTKAANGTTFQTATRSITGTSTAAR